MSVGIDIELKSGDAVAEIGAIAAELEALSAAGDDIDFDLNFDDLSIDKISEIADELERVSETINEINLDLDVDGQVDRLEERLGNLEVGFDSDGPTGSTGDGDSTGVDPPGDGSGTFSKSDFESKIEDLFGFEKDSVTLVDNLDSDRLNEISQKLKSTISEGGIRNLDKSLPTDMKESLVVDRESLGKVGFEKAVRDKQGAFDFPEQTVSRSDSFREAVEISPFDSEIEFAKADRRSRNVPDTDLRDSAFSKMGRGDSVDLDSFSVPFLKGKGSASSIDGIKNSFGKFGKKLRNLKPTMQMIWSIIAAILPILIGLGTQLLGVAAAMGSVAVAGAALIGLGLIGHGESMAAAYRKAKKQIRDLGKELFEVFQPTAQEFAPIQERIFDAIPEASKGIAIEMQGLTKFEDTLFNLGSMGAAGIKEFFAIINRNQGAISQLSERFAALGGAKLLSFFELLIKTAYQNQELIIRLGAVMMDFATVVYNVSMAAARLASVLGPLTNFIASLSGLLNNSLVVGLLTTLGVFSAFIYATYSAVTAVTALVGWLSAFGGAGLVSSIVGSILYITGQMWGLVTSLWAAVGASGALLTALSALTLGGFAVVAGAAGMAAADSMTPDAPKRRGTTYNDNRQFTINNNGSGNDYASQKAMEDTVKRVSNTESSMQPPPVDTSSSTSDGG